MKEVYAWYWDSFKSSYKVPNEAGVGWYRYNARIVSSLVGLLQIVSYMLHPCDASLKKFQFLRELIWELDVKFKL
jgi:hypothetical protein